MFTSRKKKLGMSVPEFVSANKDLLIIVADPKTDSIYVAYNNKIVAGNIKSADGKKLHVVRSVLKDSLFQKNIDLFIASIVDTIKLPLRKGNQFFMFLDGAIFNIAKSLAKKNKIKSPFVPESHSDLSKN